MTPLKAIRAKCLDCSGSATEVRLCPVTGCPLYKFRFGKNPRRKWKLTEEEKQERAEHLKKAREKKEEIESTRAYCS